MSERILVTGGQGLVGTALAAEALARGLAVRVSGRRRSAGGDPRREFVQTGELDGTTDWRAALAGVDAVVHCAARVHVMRDQAADPLLAFRGVNTAGTLNLARQAAAAGVRRFVFISSVKVNGEATADGQAFSERDAAAPRDPYGISKHEAEVGLRELARSCAMEVVIIRPPLVYGPGVKANFAALLGAVKRGLPLPFGALANRRSLVSLENLVDFIATCLTHPRAANQTFLVSDGHDLSTAELVRGMARAAHVAPRLLPVPAWLLRAAAALVGKRDAADRVCGNLQVDINKARTLLGWTPPASVEQGLARTVMEKDEI
jgi:nucleoside-diphosphate-sugar epimerase